MAFNAGVLPFGVNTPPVPLWSGGPSLGQFYNFPGSRGSSVGSQLPVTHTRFELGQVDLLLAIYMLGWHEGRRIRPFSALLQDPTGSLAVVVLS